VSGAAPVKPPPPAVSAARGGEIGSESRRRAAARIECGQAFPSIALFAVEPSRSRRRPMIIAYSPET